MHARIHLAGARVTARFWAEHDATTHVLSEHLPELHAALEQNGLEVGELTCRTGSPPEPSGSPCHLPALLEERV